MFLLELLSYSDTAAMICVLTQKKLYCTYVCGSVCEREKLMCAFSSLQSGVKAAVCECEFT